MLFEIAVFDVKNICKFLSLILTWPVDCFDRVTSPWPCGGGAPDRCPGI